MTESARREVRVCRYVIQRQLVGDVIVYVLDGVENSWIRHHCWLDSSGQDLNHSLCSLGDSGAPALFEPDIKEALRGRPQRVATDFHDALTLQMLFTDCLAFARFRLDEENNAVVRLSHVQSVRLARGDDGRGILDPWRLLRRVDACVGTPSGHQLDRLMRMHRYLAIVPPNENAAAVPGNELTDADHRVRTTRRVAQEMFPTRPSGSVWTERMAR